MSTTLTALVEIEAPHPRAVVIRPDRDGPVPKLVNLRTHATRRDHQVGIATKPKRNSHGEGCPFLAQRRASSAGPHFPSYSSAVRRWSREAKPITSQSVGWITAEREMPGVGPGDGTRPTAHAAPARRWARCRKTPLMETEATGRAHLGSKANSTGTSDARADGQSPRPPRPTPYAVVKDLEATPKPTPKAHQTYPKSPSSQSPTEPRPTPKNCGGRGFHRSPRPGESDSCRREEDERKSGPRNRRRKKSQRPRLESEADEFRPRLLGRKSDRRASGTRKELFGRHRGLPEGGGRRIAIRLYGSMLHDRFFNSEWVQPNTSLTAGPRRRAMVQIRIERTAAVSSLKCINLRATTPWWLYSGYGRLRNVSPPFDPSAGRTWRSRIITTLKIIRNELSDNAEQRLDAVAGAA